MPAKNWLEPIAALPLEASVAVLIGTYCHALAAKAAVLDSGLGSATSDWTIEKLNDPEPARADEPCHAVAAGLTASPVSAPAPGNVAVCTNIDAVDAVDRLDAPAKAAP